MSRYIFKAILVCLLTALVTPIASAQSIELRLADGNRWSGQVEDRVELRFLQQNTEVTMVGTIVQAGDLFLMVDGTIGGNPQRRTIFKSDIRAIRTLDGSEDAQREQQRTNDRTRQDRSTTRDQTADDEKGIGVFLLPLSGTVGIELRHQEIEAMGREADKHGPGQIIVLLIDSPGGLVLEGDYLARVLTDIKSRHRVIAWVDQAISMAAMLASFCDEIYFTTFGQMGAMTAGMLMADSAFEGEQLQRWMRMTGDFMEAGGRSRYIAEAMIHTPRMLSYDKDPETGVVTWYNDLSGEFILSRANENLSFTASTAMHSGFADGIADTEEELAKLLDLPRWREINDVGRRLHADWMSQVERARDEVPRIFSRMNRGRPGGTQLDNLNYQIQQITRLLQWWDRAPNVLRYEIGLPPKEVLERTLAELRKQVADIRRQQSR